MRNFVIAIPHMAASMSAAERCMKSGAKYDMKIEPWAATTPKDDVLAMFEARGINPHYFNEQGNSYIANCMSAFMSHYRIWEWCDSNEEEVTIFEHDAVLIDRIPTVPYDAAITFGQPSYGNWQQPTNIGVGPLTHKNYFGGAHAYRIKPKAARAFIYQATIAELAGPTDVFINKDWFPWLQEYYPWPVIAQDAFTTIQREGGCRAKHNWDPDKYGIYQVQ